MDRYQRSRTYTRPYQTTCGMNGGQNSRSYTKRAENHSENQSDLISESRNTCQNDSPRVTRSNMTAGALDDMTLAMAYVPWQPMMREIHRLNDALCLGTLFPELCKPFCGCRKRGGGR